MQFLRHKLPQITALVAAVLFLWLGAMHGAAKLEFAVSPQAYGYALSEICGDEDSAGGVQHCPQCVVLQIAEHRAETSAPIPAQLIVAAYYTKTTTPERAPAPWQQPPVRGPPILI